MIARAVNLHRSAVEREAAVRVERERANAERGRVGIDDSTARGYGRHYRIHGWRRDRPELGIGHGHALRDDGGLRGGHCRRSRGGLAHFRTRAVTNRARNRYRLVRCRVILDRHGNIDGGARSRDSWRCHLCARVCDADRVHGLEPSVAIDTASRVPATARLLVDDLDCEHVGPAKFRGAGREVTFEGRKSVGTGANLRAIEVHGAVHVDTVELNEDLLSRACSRQREGLSVPPGAAIEVPAASAGCRALVERERDAPIVRNIERRPRRIVESRGLRAAHVAEMELPGGVKAHRGRALAVVGVDEPSGCDARIHRRYRHPRSIRPLRITHRWRTFRPPQRRHPLQRHPPLRTFRPSQKRHPLRRPRRSQLGLSTSIHRSC